MGSLEEEEWPVCLAVFAVAGPAFAPVGDSSWTGVLGCESRPVEAGATDEGPTPWRGRARTRGPFHLREVA